jgi:hypothetical protein
MSKMIIGKTRKNPTSVCWDDETGFQVKELAKIYGNVSSAVGNGIRMLYLFHHPEEVKKAAEAAGIMK